MVSLAKGSRSIHWGQNAKTRREQIQSATQGGFGGEMAAAAPGTGEQKPAKLGSADDAASS